MVLAYAFVGFDITKINYNSITTASEFTTTKTEFAAYYANGYEEHFGGKNLTYDADGRMTGGTVTTYEAKFGDTVFYMEFSMAAAKIQAVIDTVSTKDDMQLMANIFKGADWLYGSDSADVLKGYAGNDRIDGNGGRDVMTGGAGKDIFAFSKYHGKNEITDFEARNSHSSHDRIYLKDSGIIDSYAELKTMMSQHGDDVLIDFGKAELTLDDVTLSQIDRADFLI
jgi:Ca2+-binding RTX toxin-like protein